MSDANCKYQKRELLGIMCNMIKLCPICEKANKAILLSVNFVRSLRVLYLVLWLLLLHTSLTHLEAKVDSSRSNIVHATCRWLACTKHCFLLALIILLRFILKAQPLAELYLWALFSFLNMLLYSTLILLICTSLKPF